MAARVPPGAALVLAVIAGVLLAAFGWLVGAHDLAVFLHAGRAVTAGQDPYAGRSSVAFRTGHAFVYPYLVAWAFVPLAALPASAAVGVFTAVSVAAIVASCALLGRRGPWPAALVLVCSTTVIGLQMGTLNAVLLFGLAFAWSRRCRPGWCGVALGVAAVAKLFLLPVIVWLVVARRYRAAAIAAGTATAILVAGWVAGPLGPAGYVRLLTSLQGHEASQSWSLTSLVHGLGVTGLAAHGVSFAVAGLVLAAGVVATRVSGDERAAFGAAVVASLLLTPIVWSSYLVLLIAPLLVASRDDVPLAIVAVATWPLVTPDRAAPWRVGVGLALAGGVALVAIYRTRRSGEPVPWRPHAGAADPLRRYRWAVVASGLGAVALLAAPPPVRSALPTLLGMAAVSGYLAVAVARARSR